ncbi:MAG: hypothetical protein ACI4AQ_04435 [Lachnospiraceae bacterium]
MRRRKVILWISIVALILFMVLMIFSRVRLSGESRYSRKVDENFFSLGMEKLNCTLEESFYLEEGDFVDVSIGLISGEILISIGKVGESPIYEGRNPEPESFRVNITESGDYLISVTGKQAEGSISFQIK